MGNRLHRRLVFVLAFLLTLLFASRIQEESGAVLNPQFVFWSVGQGDFMTYIGKKQCWFFDLGGDRFLSLKDLVQLKSDCYGKSHTVFISHFDKDHIRFYQRLDQMIPLHKAYVSHTDAKTKISRKMLRYFQNRGIEVLQIGQGHEIKTPEVSVRVLWPPKDFTTAKNDENSKSLVLSLKTFRRRILLTGDLPGKWEKYLNQVSADILKVAHHGSHKSSFNNFLSRIRARTCVISVGKRNSFGHPRKELLDRLRDNHCAVLRTDRLGTIKMEL